MVISLPVLLIALALFIAGVGIGYFIASRSAQAAALRASELQATIQELRAQLDERVTKITTLTADLSAAQVQLMNAESRANEAAQTVTAQADELTRLARQNEERAEAIADLRARLEAANRILADDAKRITDVKTEMANAFNELAAAALQERQSAFDRDAQQKRESIDALLKPLNDRLTNLDEAIKTLDKARESGQSSLGEQLRLLTDAQREITTKTHALETATSALSTALANPRVRGNWGEQTLDNVIEIAGMSEYCDVLDQHTLRDDEAQGRPDKLVRIPHANGERVVVDAKAPGEFFKAACEAASDADRKTALTAHARAIIAHVDDLASRDYSRYENVAPFVIMFVPNEGMLAAAVAEVPDLVERAQAKRVVLASPLMLLLYLRSYAFGWRQMAREENVEHIAEAAQELYRRLGTFVEHFDNVGRHIASAADFYGKAVGSYERGLLPQAQRMERLGSGDARKKDSVEALKARNIEVRRLVALPTPARDATSSAVDGNVSQVS